MILLPSLRAADVAARIFGALALAVFLSSACAVGAAAAQSNLRLPDGMNAGAPPPPADAKPSGSGQTFEAPQRTDMWRDVRGGVRGKVGIPDKKSGLLVQSNGAAWRAIRNGPLSTGGLWALAGIFGVLALFFLIRGRIRIESGRAGETITRFSSVERMGHWLFAGSFIILALSGLLTLYGRYALPDLIGKEAFAIAAGVGKSLHNYVAFAFILGLVWVFLAWVLHNLPSRTDIFWLLRGGGLFTRGSHPPARKFNAGQKIVFWLTVLGGLSLALSGWALLFPFTTTMFSDTFGMINGLVGSNLPTNLELVEEQQLAQLWHTVMGLFLIVVVVAHIYLGTVGMEGAFAAMGSGEVDLNWAKEHHSLWVEEERSRARGGVAEGAAHAAE